MHVVSHAICPGALCGTALRARRSPAPVLTAPPCCAGDDTSEDDSCPGSDLASCCHEGLGSLSSLPSVKAESYGAHGPDDFSLLWLNQALQDPAACPLALTCGSGGLAPVATAVPHVIRGVCERYRQHVAADEWQGIRAAFSRLVAPHCRNALSSSGCPHFLHVPHAADRTNGHRPTTCPCCAVLCVAATTLQVFIDDDTVVRSRLCSPAWPLLRAVLRCAVLCCAAGVMMRRCCRPWTRRSRQ